MEGVFNRTALALKGSPELVQQGLLVIDNQ
jgi:hypothetical protein